jgi:hypothetical protein
MANTTKVFDRGRESAADLEAAGQGALRGPLLVAGSTDESVSGALHLAELLTRRDRVAAHVLGVVSPIGFPVRAFVEVDREPLEEGRRRQHLERVRRRVHQTVGQSGQYTVHTVTGSPASALADAALERGAA